MTVVHPFPSEKAARRSHSTWKEPSQTIRFPGGAEPTVKFREAAFGWRMQLGFALVIFFLVYLIAGSELILANVLTQRQAEIWMFSSLGFVGFAIPCACRLLSSEQADCVHENSTTAELYDASGRKVISASPLVTVKESRS